MNKASLGIGALILAINTIACSSRRDPATTRAAQKPQTAVELDVFSGRPNPTWNLPETDTRTLEAMLQSLPTAPATVKAETLGYRGFVIRLTSDTGAVSTIRVYKGAVQQSTGTTVVYHSDPGGKVEAWLLNTGKSTLNPETYEYVQKEVASHGR